MSLSTFVNDLLNTNLNGWFKSIFNGPSYPVITGSYIYKHLLRGEEIEDVDLVVESLEKFKDIYGSVYEKLLLTYPFKGLRYHLKRKDIKYLDIISVDTYLELLEKNGLTPINSLILTKDGIEHVYNPKELRERFKISENFDPINERDWMVDNFERGRYCKWSTMRKKDIEYFSSFDIIDEEECECHYIY